MEQRTDPDDMMDYLDMVGADPVEAKRKVHAMMGVVPATFMEIYGGGAINDCANLARRGLGLKVIGVLDLRIMKPDGSPWDFTRQADRRAAREMIDVQDPDWLIGPPPCKCFSIWNYAMNYPKVDKAKVQAAVAEGCIHLNAVASLYRKQMMKGKYFPHEHPTSAHSWKEDSNVAIAMDPTVHIVVAHQCMYGLAMPVSSSGNERLPALKPLGS